MLQRVFYAGVVSLLFSIQSNGQDKKLMDTCETIKQTTLTAFVIGADHGWIKSDYLTNGFELKLSDTAYRVQSFRISFDNHPDILTMSVSGKTAKESSNSEFSLKKIDKAKIIAIDNIIAIRNNKCYRIPALKYRIGIWFPSE